MVKVGVTGTNVDRSDLGLAVVDAVHARADGHGVEEAVLVAVHPPRADDGRFGESVLDGLLTLELGAVVGGLGRRGGVEMRDVDETRDTRELGDARDAAGARDVDVVVREVPGFYMVSLESRKRRRGGRTL